MIRAIAFLVALASPVTAQPYNFWAQQQDIQNLQDDLAQRQRETPYEDYRAQEKLREQEDSLRNMQMRNNEALSDWLVYGDKPSRW